MKKIDKFKNLTGATVSFSVETPFSGEGEKQQHVVLKVEGVFLAKNGEWYVKGISLKRLVNSATPEYRQYQIERIYDRTIAIINDNEWTKSQPSLRRLGDNGLRQVPLNKHSVTLDMSRVLKKT